MIRLFVEGTELKISDEAQTKQTLQAARLDNDNLIVEHTEFFTIPARPNLTVFRGAHFVEVQNARVYQATLVTSTRNITGEIIAKEFTENTIKIAFAANNLKSLKDKNLKEIDCGTVTLAESQDDAYNAITTINDNFPDSKAVFPEIYVKNYIGDDTVRTINVNDSYGFFVAMPVLSHIIQSICNHAGYSVYGDFFENFSNVILYGNRSAEKRKYTHYAVFLTESFSKNYKNTEELQSFTFPIPYSNTIKDEENLLSENIYTAPEAGDYYIRVDMKLTMYGYWDDLSEIKIYYKKNDSKVKEEKVPIKANQHFTKTATINNVSNGDTLKAEFYVLRFVEKEEDEPYLVIESGTIESEEGHVYFEFLDSFTKEYYSEYPLQKSLPDENANNFLNIIRKFFGQALFIDNDKKEIEITSWKDVISGTNVIDITDYVSEYKKKKQNTESFEIAIKMTNDNLYKEPEDTSMYTYIGEYKDTLPAATKQGQIAKRLSQNAYLVSDKNLVWNFLYDDIHLKTGSGEEISINAGPLINNKDSGVIKPGIGQKGTIETENQDSNPGIHLFYFSQTNSEINSFDKDRDTGDHINRPSLTINKENSMYDTYIKPYLDYITSREEIEVKAILPEQILAEVENCLLPFAKYRKIRYKGKVFIPVKIETQHGRETRTKITMI